MRSEEKGQLVWEVATEQSPINSDPNDNRITRKIMQTET